MQDLTPALTPPLWLPCGQVLELGYKQDCGFLTCKMGVLDYMGSEVPLALKL